MGVCVCVFFGEGTLFGMVVKGNQTENHPSFLFEFLVMFFLFLFLWGGGGPSFEANPWSSMFNEDLLGLAEN